jgi:hypothetical protein
MRKRLISLFVLVVFVFGMASVVSAEGRWKWIFSNDNYGGYFDTETIKLDNTGVIDVWIKFINAYPDNKGIKEEIQNVHLYTNSRKYSIGYRSAYNKNGKVINYNDFKFSDLAVIIPGSDGEAIYNACYAYVHRY